MFTKVLIVAAVLASTAAAPAHACTINCGVKFNGISLNGVNLNGFTLNGFTLNGLTLNGFTLNGIGFNGLTLNGGPLNNAINVGGHQGVGLNGQVIAIEF
jgi:uncharacterized protein YjbI with pentapeptide repeats